MESKKRTLLQEASIEQLIKELNRREINLFVCHDCQKVNMGTPDYLATSKWGYERPFCYDCVKYCNHCEESYCSNMSYRHEECEQDKGDDQKEN